MFAGQVMVGACASTTVIVNEQVSVSWAASVAVQVTVVGPVGKLEPEGGLHTKLTPEQLSVAVAVKLTTAEHWPGSVFC